MSSLLPESFLVKITRKLALSHVNEKEGEEDEKKDEKEKEGREGGGIKKQEGGEGGGGEARTNERTSFCPFPLRNPSFLHLLSWVILTCLGTCNKSHSNISYIKFTILYCFQ
jgi:hypothetical protein